MSNQSNASIARHIKLKKVSELFPYANNARVHSDEQINKIAASITEFGFNNPILIDSEHGIIAGHGRLLAAKQLGLKEVPVLVLDHLTAAQKKAYIIADNKLSDLATWNETLLAEELDALRDIDYNLDAVGFSDDELDSLFSSLYDPDQDEADSTHIELEESPVTQHGQVWLLGDHRVMCADTFDRRNFKSLLGDELAVMTFTDPPYDVNYQGPVNVHNKNNSRVIANDNLKEDFGQFLLECCQNILKFTKGACYICMGTGRLHSLHRAFKSAGGNWSMYLIWVKNNFTLSRSDYHSQYEAILYGWPNGRERVWCGGRDQSNVWHIDRELKNDLHPTMKPVALCERAIGNSSHVGDIVLDCFGGSGSTLIACEKLNRHCRMMEIEPAYVDVIVKRWQHYTGQEAIDEQSGKTFNTLLSQAQQQTDVIDD